MKKFLAPVVVSLALLLAGSAFAQVTGFSDEADHQLEVVIPSIMLIRINASATPIVSFSPDADTYFAAVDAGDDLSATADASDLLDIEVWASTAWVVSAAADGFVDAALNPAVGLSLADVTVTPSGAWSDASVSPFTLDSGAGFASGDVTEGAWRSLGISAASYTLAVQGDEAAGSYSTTVTYSIAAP